MLSGQCWEVRQHLQPPPPLSFDNHVPAHHHNCRFDNITYYMPDLSPGQSPIMVKPTTLILSPDNDTPCLAPACNPGNTARPHRSLDIIASTPLTAPHSTPVLDSAKGTNSLRHTNCKHAFDVTARNPTAKIHISSCAYKVLRFGACI